MADVIRKSTYGSWTSQVVKPSAWLKIKEN